jgi:hypothetical protein
MEREVFILPNGTSFTAWQVRFGERRQHIESVPCTYHESERISRNGTVHITVESAEVSFCACPDSSFQVGQKGQLSSSEDQFFDVSIGSIEPAGDHVIVCGKASRKAKFGRER